MNLSDNKIKTSNFICKLKNKIPPNDFSKSQTNVWYKK